MESPEIGKSKLLQVLLLLTAAVLLVGCLAEKATSVPAVEGPTAESTLEAATPLVDEPSIMSTPMPSME